MIVDGEIDAYFSDGRIQPYTHVFALTLGLRDEAGEFTGKRMDAAIRNHFEPSLAAKLVGKDGMNRVDDEPVVWQSEDGHDAIDLGWIFFADEIDWDEGKVRISWVPTDRDTADWMFPSGDFFESEFDRADYEAEFGGMSFSFSAIEMLLPSSNLELVSSGIDRDVGRTTRVGRPQKWDWEGAISHVVARAQTPDGLPTGHGAQARIEEMIADWFVSQKGDAPASSQVRERAAKIIRSLETPETPDKN